MKYVTLIKLSAEGRHRYPESAKLFDECVKVTEQYGGKLLETFAVVGPYDFVSIADYPTSEAGFQSRLKLFELGVFDELDSLEAFDMDVFMSSV